jgi:hypothetical protein
MSDHIDLEKLLELKEQGHITQTEYDNKKAQFLSQQHSAPTIIDPKALPLALMLILIYVGFAVVHLVVWIVFSVSFYQLYIPGANFLSALVGGVLSMLEHEYWLWESFLISGAFLIIQLTVFGLVLSRYFSTFSRIKQSAVLSIVAFLIVPILYDTFHTLRFQELMFSFDRFAYDALNTLFYLVVIYFGMSLKNSLSIRQ